MTTTLRHCHICQKETKRKPSQKRDGTPSDKVFCSRECYQKYHAVVIDERACKICGSLFHVSSFSKRTICKTSCRQKHRVSECKVCRCKFSAISPRSAGGYARVTRVLCSPECKSVFMRTDQARKDKISAAFTGELHPMWRGGVRGGLQSRGRFWASVRAGVFAAKGGHCEACGISRADSKVKYGCDLHIDHIKPWHECENEAEANHIDNLRPLCISCHGKEGAKCAHGRYSPKGGLVKDLEYMLRVYGKKCNLTLENAAYIKKSYSGDWVSASNIAALSAETGVSRTIIRSIAKGEHWINAYI